MEEIEQQKIPENAPEKIWVLLVRKQEGDKIDFQQTGPWSVQEVLEQIHSGDATFEDHVWRSGFKQWMRVGDIEDFTGFKSTPTVAIFEGKSEDSPKVFKQTVAPEESVKEEAPQEAKGDDEVSKFEPYFELDDAEIQEASEPSPDGTAMAESVPEASVEVGYLASDFSDEDLIEEMMTTENPKPVRDTEKILGRLGAGLVAGGMGVLLLAVWWHLNRPPTRVATEDGDTQESVAEDIASSEESLVDQKGDASAVLKENSIKESPKVATKLKVVPVKTGNGNVRIEIETDLPVGTILSGRVRAVTGKVMSRSPVNEKFDVVLRSGEKPVVDLSRFSLPMGRYDVILEGGGKSLVTSVLLGGTEKEMGGKIARWQKGMSGKVKSERALIRSVALQMKEAAADIDFQFKRLGSRKGAWARFYTNWKQGLEKRDHRRLNQMDPKREVAFPKEVRELKELRKELLDRGNKLNAKVRSGNLTPLPKSDLERNFRRLQYAKLR